MDSFGGSIVSIRREELYQNEPYPSEQTKIDSIIRRKERITVSICSGVQSE